MPGSLPVGADLSDVVLVVGAIDGRNIWRADLAGARDTLERARALGAKAVTVATTNSLQHVPHDTALEQWDDERLNADLHSWLAFADQKVEEVVTLARGLDDGWDSVSASIDRASAALAQRATAPGVVRPEVRARTAALGEADRRREDYPQREAAQRGHKAQQPPRHVQQPPVFRAARLRHRFNKDNARNYRIFRKMTFEEKIFIRKLSYTNT